MDRFMTRRATPAAGLPDTASVAVQPQNRRVASLVTLAKLRLVHAAARHTGPAHGWNQAGDGMPIRWRPEVEEFRYVGAHDFHLAAQWIAEATATATGPLLTRPARPGRTRLHRHGSARRPTSNGGPWTSPSPSPFATAPAPAVGKGPGRTRPRHSSWTA
ncbi:hypothetical protein [Kitasatospora sp. NPDC058190]|uniref:hypothetical protein n=1 Tax=Kitasatospora sp. NPDC058190 TaxID=3346371 RepID=UPI0036DB7D07